MAVLTMCYLTMCSVAREAMAASSSSVMSMARLNGPGLLVLKVGALPYALSRAPH